MADLKKRLAKPREATPVTMRVNVSPEDYVRIFEHCEARGDTMSAFMRESALTEIERIEEQGHS